MALRKETDQESVEKDFWHPYGLQALSPEKFALITSLILKGKHGLILFGRKEMAPSGRA